MEDKIVEVTIQTKGYGKTGLYPKNTNAILFAELCNTITLTPFAVGIIKQMGYEIKVVPFIHPSVAKLVCNK